MDQEPAQTRPMKRVSNACVPCRSRHMKCDSATPACSRCEQEGSHCVYLKSRRGGVRRRRPATLSGESSQTPRITPTSQPRSESVPNVDSAAYPIARPVLERETGADLLTLYYSFFHAAHPCVLPQWSLGVRAALQPDSLETLMPVLHYIGSLYSPDIQSSQLEGNVLRKLEALRCSGRTPSPFEIQALILYSIAVYWCDEIQRSLDLLDEAIQGAVAIGMRQAGFDIRYGEGDPVLEESWRRTWWVIYLTATHMAGSTHTFPSKVEGIALSVGLPCEEECYESGNIPPVPTLDEYEMREFQGCDVEFSSFAELIGLSRSLDLVLSERWQTGSDAANRVCANADTSILAWLLLLPAQKQSLVRESGTVDQLLFRAHMLIYAYIVDLNRELSTLLSTSLESISRRSPRPPPLSLSFSLSSAWNPLNPRTNFYTTKVLTAIEKMNGLLTLPTHLSLHTPFIICMISNTAIAHLSAYKWVYTGPRLQIERERIRLIVAVLRTLSEYWPLGKRTYREVVTIAKEILSVDDVGSGSGAGLDLDIEGNGAGDGSGELVYPEVRFEGGIGYIGPGGCVFQEKDQPLVEAV